MGILQSIELWLITLVATVAILAGFGVFARWCSFSPAVPRRKLEELHVGMTTEQVQTLLGAPRDMMHQGDGSSQWVYGARMKRHMLIIEFNKKSVVQSFAHGVPDTRRAAASKD
jgi:outer membrane protein assembly factor BamE (lipoprotein component of BamABCDE complex)